MLTITSGEHIVLLVDFSDSAPVLPTTASHRRGMMVMDRGMMGEMTGVADAPMRFDVGESLWAPVKAVPKALVALASSAPSDSVPRRWISLDMRPDPGPKAMRAHQLSMENPLLPLPAPTVMDNWRARRDSNS